MQKFFCTLQTVDKIGCIFGFATDFVYSLSYVKMIFYIAVKGVFYFTQLNVIVIAVPLPVSLSSEISAP